MVVVVVVVDVVVAPDLDQKPCPATVPILHSQLTQVGQVPFETAAQCSNLPKAVLGRTSSF